MVALPRRDTHVRRRGDGAARHDVEDEDIEEGGAIRTVRGERLDALAALRTQHPRLLPALRARGARKTLVHGRPAAVRDDVDHVAAEAARVLTPTFRSVELLVNVKRGVQDGEYHNENDGIGADEPHVPIRLKRCQVHLAYPLTRARR